MFLYNITEFRKYGEHTAHSTNQMIMNDMQNLRSIVLEFFLNLELTLVFCILDS